MLHVIVFGIIIGNSIESSLPQTIIWVEEVVLGKDSLKICSRLALAGTMKLSMRVAYQKKSLLFLRFPSRKVSGHAG
jgi:hypothetical protein